MATATTASSSQVLLPNTLIIVCCHAIYLGSTHNHPDAESSWLIEPFQTGEVPTYISHIKAGVDTLEKYGDEAILCFSGGRTKPKLTNRSEAEGYAEVARALRLVKPHHQDRIFCDNWATDSFQNIMCSLFQWPQWVTTITGGREPGAGAEVVAWPKKLVIISHNFKKKRFVKLHLPALRWNYYPPKSKSKEEEEDTVSIEFIGIDPPFDQKRMTEILQGDLLRGYGVWKDDLYGAGKVLSDKREKRGWVESDFLSSLSSSSPPVLVDLLRWKGAHDGITIFPHVLPWEQGFKT